jgi:hypothetical protein
MNSLFVLGKSPSLGLIATRFLCLYLYLGVSVLSMRRVALVFHGRRHGIKSLERRMYLVLNFLEILGVVEQTHCVSEYRLILDATAIVALAMNERKQEYEKSRPGSFESLLSRYNRSALDEMYAKRLEIFMNSTGAAR